MIAQLSTYFLQNIAIFYLLLLCNIVIFNQGGSHDGSTCGTVKKNNGKEKYESI